MNATPAHATEALFRAAVRGDLERARQLIFAGAQPCRFEEGRVASADEVARAAGHEQVADAIRDALAQRSTDEQDGRRRALLSRCADPDEVVRAIHDAAEPGTELLLTGASSSPDPELAVRLLAWSGGAETVTMVHDTWLRTAERAGLVRELAASYRVFEGGCDALVATMPRTCWATEGPRLRVWVNGRLSMALDERRLLLTRGQRRVYARSSLRDVRVRLSSRWDRHAVELVFDKDHRREVAARREHSATLDPTYDHDMLVIDAAWAVNLSRAIGLAAGVPVHLPEELD